MTSISPDVVLPEWPQTVCAPSRALRRRRHQGVWPSRPPAVPAPPAAAAPSPHASGRSTAPRTHSQTSPSPRTGYPAAEQTIYTVGFWRFLW